MTDNEQDKQNPDKKADTYARPGALSLGHVWATAVLSIGLGLGIGGYISEDMFLKGDALEAAFVEGCESSLATNSERVRSEDGTITVTFTEAAVQDCVADSRAQHENMQAGMDNLEKWGWGISALGGALFGAAYMRGRREKKREKQRLNHLLKP